MRKLIGLLVVLLLAVVIVPMAAQADSHRHYANSKKSVSDLTGLTARIETADPNVADEGGFSLQSIWIVGPNAGNGDRQWVEVGWQKQSNGNLRFFSYCAPQSVCGGYKWHGTVGVGSAHDYKLLQTTGNEWKFYIDGVRKRTETAGFSEGKRADVGGEVTDEDSDIGVSGLLNVKYERDGSGPWTKFNGRESADDGFWIIELWDTNHNMQNGTCWHYPGHC